MKKWTRRITILLILGAVTTVGVAWAIVYLDVEAAFAANWSSNSGVQVEPREEELAIAREMGPEGEFGVFQRRRTGFRERTIQRHPEFSSVQMQMTRPVVEFIESGLPLRALQNEVRHGPDLIVDPSVHNHSVTFRTQVYWELAKDEVEVTVCLPLRPLFPDFLINTLFYAAIWFGLFLAAGRTRRFIRTRRGRCPRCGYDLRREFNDGCPECGWGRPEAER